jgi:DNA repair protein RadA/Sms
MPKSTVTFVCTSCGGESPRWAGQCPHCQAWNTLQEYEVRRPDSKRAAKQAGAVARMASPSRAIPLSQVSAEAAPRLALAWDELNRVLGGGIVPGSLVLVGGEPGVGKSTLLMHAAHQVAAGPAGRRVLYVSGEESVQQVQIRARRLEAVHDGILMLAENDLDAIADTITAEAPQLAIVDSIQTVTDSSLNGSAGSVTQVRESAARLMRLAKETAIPIFLVGHVTKEGAIAGPRVLEHIVDTVLYLEGDRRQELRLLRAMKNRFGSAEEIGVFAMGEKGLVEVTDPSLTALADSTAASTGTAVVVVMEGSRPLMLEIQSLTNSPNASYPPRRVANGFDVNRLHMLLAVLDKRGAQKSNDKDVFVNVAGGIRITEPAADLGLALSVVSNLSDVPLPGGTVVIGELGLAGEVRRVSQLQRRLQEAARHGFTRALIPAGSRTGRPSGLDVVEVRTLAEAISAAFPKPMKSGAFIEETRIPVS